MLLQVAEAHLLEHRAVQSLSPRDPLKRGLDRAVAELANAYQRAGAKMSRAMDAEEAAAKPAKRRPARRRSRTESRTEA